MAEGALFPVLRLFVPFEVPGGRWVFGVSLLVRGGGGGGSGDCVGVAGRCVIAMPLYVDLGGTGRAAPVDLRSVDTPDGPPLLPVERTIPPPHPARAGSKRGELEGWSIALVGFAHDEITRRRSREIGALHGLQGLANNHSG